MNKQTLKTTGATVAIALIASAGMAFRVSAATGSSPVNSATTIVPKEALATKRQLLAERQQKIAQEALEAVTGTQHALLALQTNDTKKATALLRDVSGKLDSLLAKYPKIDLIAANVDAEVDDFDSDSAHVQKMVDQADILLREHKVQDARYLLDELVSEARITTTSIPLGTYPAAIKEAAKLIDQGKTEEAKDALYAVLSLLDKTTEIMPLPVLKAEALLTAASELEHQSDLKKETSRDEILKLTDAAKDQLKLAEILGYGAKDDYKELYDAIDEIKDVIHTQKAAATWDKLKNSLSALKNKIIHTGQ